jgi:hypothetical protein
MMISSIRQSIVLFVLGLIILSVSCVDAQDFPAPKPTAEHKKFTEELGTWDAEMFMAQPGSEELSSIGKGIETNALLTGGLWMASEYAGDLAGTKFEGRGQYGFDANTGKYVGTWIDSMAPRITSF